MLINGFVSMKPNRMNGVGKDNIPGYVKVVRIGIGSVCLKPISKATWGKVRLRVEGGPDLFQFRTAFKDMFNCFTTGVANRTGWIRGDVSFKEERHGGKSLVVTFP